MKQIVSKKFIDAGYKFLLELELNTRIEKRIDGDRWHTLTIYFVEGDSKTLFRTESILDSNLEQEILNVERSLEVWVTSQLSIAKYERDPRLEKLGFFKK